MDSINQTDRKSINLFPESEPLKIQTCNKKLFQLHQKFVFALTLIRNPKTYSEGFLFLTEIDESLKYSTSTQQALDHIVL